MTELFETFDSNGKSLALVPRDQVHHQGLIHRAVHVMLFNAQGDLLVQRRADNKDVCPGRWDLSCGEHLKPGESFAEAAQRGIFEELGITLNSCPLRRIRGEHLQDNLYSDRGVHDVEMAELWVGRWDAAVSADGVEVAELAWCPWPRLVEQLQTTPEQLTPWFCDELGFLVREKNDSILFSQLAPHRP